jgi:pimeloyl-ACP methyl ester carboxylesterase
MEQRVVRTDRLEFHIRTHGDPDGLPMLLVHGSFGSGRWWESLMAVLPEAICAVAPDLRGCGGSSKPESGYTVPELAQDLVGLVEALGWHDFDLVGHSSGGAVAMEYALQAPDRVRTLTLVDSVPVEGVFTPVEGLRILDQMRHDEALLAQALRILMPTFAGIDETGSTKERAFFADLVHDAQRMAPAAFTGVAEALGQWNRFHDARVLTRPTLLIWGELDSVVERDASTRTLIAIPGAVNLTVLQGVGHSPMLEAPVTLAEHLIEFITDDFDEYDEARALV